ncbi:hypothetical protein N7462_004680 [Penicillium macrosclerotiorum]|uniref:uncharacterized protein n=1 Tax=Penicillium macrosclerotiorum TaxID=303699 RepID=UPI0025477E2E|nr:uncharacterized protein N7462_004680 [Penicillium macrosclerotiorum]KAJ5690288.1 hypothetical protein N7462_004680 [Penicillium macrosclerotiorum]
MENRRLSQESGNAERKGVKQGEEEKKRREEEAAKWFQKGRPVWGEQKSGGNDKGVSHVS